MRLFQSWLFCAANISYFILLLFGGPQRGCQADRLQPQIQPPASASTNRSFTKPVAGAAAPQQMVSSRHPLQPLINFNGLGLSTSTKQEHYRNVERELLVDLSVEPQPEHSANSTVAFASEAKNPASTLFLSSAVASSWSRESQQEHEQNRRPREQQLQGSLRNAAASPVDGRDETVPGLPAVAVRVEVMSASSGSVGAIDEAGLSLQAGTQARRIPARWDSSGATSEDSSGATSEEEPEALQVLNPLTAAPAPGPGPILNCTGAISEVEHQALQDLYLATGGANWTWHNINSSSGESQWVFTSNLTAPCTNRWEGVYCAPYYGPAEASVSCVITALVLPITGLRGQLPASIASLLHLQILNLQTNHLEGAIPSSLGNLTALTLLYLFENSLTGSIPPSLGDLASLTLLYLDTNFLTGLIPSSLGNLTALTQLALYENLLSGSIPSSLGNLKALTQLYLESNSLTGPIPSSLSDLAALTILALDDNSLTGPIQSLLGNLTALTKLYLFENFLTGSIPSSLANLTALTLLDLYDNFLTGSIPFLLGTLTALEELYFYRNSLTGSMPSSLGDLTALMVLYWDENSLTGPIPSSLGNLILLTQLSLYKNSLTGLIPSSLGDLTALTLLDLYGNSLTGPIPSSLGDLTALTIMLLYGNSLTGSIPSSLGQLKVLRQLSASYNSLIGTIPSSLGLLGKCFYFNMSSNSLTGPIPAELGNLGSNLSISDKLVRAGVALDLSQNALSGTLSPHLFSQQMQTILLYSNCMQGSLLAEICSSSNLQTLVLDKLTSGSSCQSRVLGFQGTFAANTLQGSIPECLWNMPLLKTLHLSGNGLHGTLGNIGSFSTLNNVDLSNNFLTGSVPPSLQTQSSLGQLDLSNNKLSGILSPSFFTGNLTLLMLVVNRLSGDLPVSFGKTSGITNFSVLTGNLFSCGSPLPAADPASSSYVCGSENLNFGLYLCGYAILVFLFLAVVAYLFASGYCEIGCAIFDKLLDQGINLMKQYSDSVSKAANFRHLVNIIETLKGWVCALGLWYLVIAMPAYAVLKSTASAGILADQYTWITTSAYLHGYVAMATVGLFVLFSGVNFVVIMQQLDQLLQRTPADLSDSQLLPARSEQLKLRNVLQRVLMQTVSLLVVLVVNVCYVYGVVFGGLSVSEQLLTQISLGLFKVLWQELFVKNVISWTAKTHRDISVGGLIFHQVAMNVVSFIVAPCFATLGTDSNCLYYALLGQESISSSFIITLFNTQCFTVNASNGDSRTICIEYPYEQSNTISISPPWFYSYQCTSALLINYIPALLVVFMTNAVAIPLLEFIFIVLIEGLAKTRLADLKFHRKQSPPSYRKQVADVLLVLLVLMTFGMASPLLGVMIVVKQMTNTLVARVSIGRYVHHAEDPSSALALLDDAAQQFRGGSTRALLGLLLVVVGIFWGAMIFDMVADLYGNTAGGIAWAVTFAAWTTAAALAYWTKLGDKVAARLTWLFRRLTGNGRSIDSATVDKSSLNLAFTKNALFAEKNHVRTADSVEIHSLNSEFGRGRDSEFEMI